MWYAVSVTPRYEIETATRINNSGHVAYCPVYIEKTRPRNRGKEFFRMETRPLFRGYAFVSSDAPFHKDKFETTRVRLIVWHNLKVSDAQMAVVRDTVEALNAEAARSPGGIAVQVGDTVNLRNALFANEPVVVLERLKKTLMVRLKRLPDGALPIEVPIDQVEAAV